VVRTLVGTVHRPGSDLPQPNPIFRHCSFRLCPVARSGCGVTRRAVEFPSMFYHIIILCRAGDIMSRPYFFYLRPGPLPITARDNSCARRLVHLPPETKPATLLDSSARVLPQPSRSAAALSPTQPSPESAKAMAGKKRKPGAEKQPKHRLPLGADADAVADASKRRRSGAAKQHQADEEASIPSSLSAKILREARKQQQEEEMLADSSRQAPSGAAAAVTGPEASSSFPVPAADDDEDGVDEFEGFDTLSEYDGGEVSD
jgi:hypothetical protein